MISVLIVDDERIIREGLKRLIKNKCPDYAVIGEAADGAQALKLTQQLHPDLAIVDIRMPLSLIHISTTRGALTPLFHPSRMPCGRFRPSFWRLPSQRLWGRD